MAGGGAKGGAIYGETEDFSFNVVSDPLQLRDFHATVLERLDHERLTFKYQGLSQRRSGVEPARVVNELVA